MKRFGEEREQFFNKNLTNLEKKWKRHTGKQPTRGADRLFLRGVKIINKAEETDFKGNHISSK